MTNPTPSPEAVEAARQASGCWITYKEMTAALTAAAPFMQPQWNTDMEAAPRDGAEILIYSVDYGVIRAKWASTGIEFGEQFTGVYMVPALTGTRADPTAWMPLPAPPKGQDDE